MHLFRKARQAPEAPAAVLEVPETSLAQAEASDAPVVTLEHTAAAIEAARFEVYRLQNEIGRIGEELAQAKCRFDRALMAHSALKEQTERRQS